jgi:hypothetical protein
MAQLIKKFCFLNEFNFNAGLDFRLGLSDSPNEKVMECFTAVIVALPRE